MRDTLAEVFRRVRARKAKWSSIEWSWISVEPEGFAGKWPQFLGIALIDRRWRGDLFNGSPRWFRVEPGEHTVTVYFRSWFRIAEYLQKAVASSLQVVVQPGESIRLRYGVNPEWKRLTALARRGTRIVVPGSLLAAAIGWLLFPILREATALAALRFDLGQPWLSIAYATVRSPMTTALFVWAVWSCPAQVAFAARIRRLIQSLERQFGKPYYVKRMVEGSNELQPAEIREMLIDPSIRTNRSLFREDSWE